MTLSFIKDIKKSGQSCDKYIGTKRYVDTGNVQGQNIVGSEPYDYDNKPSRANVMVSVGDVLFAKMQNSIKVICIDEHNKDYIYSTGFYCFRDDRILPAFLKYYFLSDAFNVQKDKLCQGATMKAINDDGMSQISLNVPDLKTQEHIVNVLDLLYQSAKEKNNQLSMYDELVKSRFIELFGDCLTNPKGWKTKCLEDIAEVGSSKRVFVEELQEDGIPFYRGTEVGALAEGKQITPELFITEEHYTELCEATGTPQIGDLLMPSICPDGRIWVVNTDKPFYFKDGRVLWVHAIDASYNPVFLLYTLKDRIMTDYSSIASGTTFAELKIFALKKCRVFDVPLALQNQFAAFVEQTDKSKLAATETLKYLEELKASLMDKYFG